MKYMYLRTNLGLTTMRNENGDMLTPQALKNLTGKRIVNKLLIVDHDSNKLIDKIQHKTAVECSSISN